MSIVLAVFVILLLGIPAIAFVLTVLMKSPPQDFPIHHSPTKKVKLTKAQKDDLSKPGIT